MPLYTVGKTDNLLLFLRLLRQSPSGRIATDYSRATNEMMPDIPLWLPLAVVGIICMMVSTILIVSDLLLMILDYDHGFVFRYK